MCVTNETEKKMMLTVTPAPITTLSLPVPREKILEAIVVFRTPDGVEVAGELSDRERNINLLLDGVQRLHAIPSNPPVSDDAR